MNLLIINSAKEWGGTEKWVVSAAAGMAKRGHTVYLGCRGRLFDDQRKARGISLVKFPFANNADLLTVALLRSFIVKNRIEVVLPSKQREYLLAGVAAKLGTSAKVAAMFAIDRPLHNLRNRFAFCSLFDMVLVCARRIVDTLAQTRGFDPGKCRVVYMGIDPLVCSPEIRAHSRKELGCADNEQCIMAIGRLTPQKGFDFALKAFERLLQKRPHTRLVIVGPGDPTPYRTLLHSKEAAGKVVFTGFRKDAGNLIQAADLYWITSRSEGIPNAMLEAMAARVPVCSFDIAGVAEALRDGEDGFLVPFGDLDALVAASERILGDATLARRLTDSAFKRVSSEFSNAAMCEAMERFLEELVKK
jgi:glycosyltransferase involved in cell wall biosynthesis